MTNSSLLPLVLLLAVSPLAAAWAPFIRCVGDATYAANSTYEANLRRLATVLTAAVNASHGSYTHRAVGFWPYRVQASAMCARRDDDDGSVYIAGIICEDGTCYGSSCAVCIAGAFRKLESTCCPYHKAAFFSDDNCTLEINEAYGRNVMKETLASGLIFQAIGFAWLFFLLLQEWHGRKRGTRTLSTPLMAEDH